MEACNGIGGLRLCSPAAKAKSDQRIAAKGGGQPKEVDGEEPPITSQELDQNERETRGNEPRNVTTIKSIWFLVNGIGATKQVY